MRTCKRCGRTLSDDEIVCRACRERDRMRNQLVDMLNDDSSPPRDHHDQTKSLGCLPIFLTIAGICIFVSLFVQPELIIDYGTDTVSIPISWQGSVQTPVSNQPPAPKSKPKEKILGENMEFAFGASSSVIDKKLDSYNYSHHLSDDQIIMTSSKNDILFGLIGLDIGRCVTITNWGFGDYDELTYYGYTLSNIEYSCLKKISNSEILEDDELSLILFSLNVIDKSATYNDLKDIFIKKYGECTDEDVNEDRGTGRAVWELDDSTVVILENDSYNVMVQHHTADSYEREKALREIRDAEALEKENSIRENRQ